MKNYFAYGSNMDIKQMQQRCSSAKVQDVAMLKDYTLGFTKFSNARSGSVADIIAKQGEKVYGILYTVSENDLKKLDTYEVVPTCYRRINLTVILQNEGEYKTEVEAFCYEVVDKDYNAGVPSFDYMNQIFMAASTNNFPKYYLDLLMKIRPKFSEEKRKVDKEKILLFLNELSDALNGNSFNETVADELEWGGADLVITGDAERYKQLKSMKPHLTTVYTPQWRELSWVVSRIYHHNLISQNIINSNRNDFCKTLGIAAQEFQEFQIGDDTYSHFGICNSVIEKTQEVLLQV